MPGDGFKIAGAYVEVTPETNKAAVRQAAKDAAGEVEKGIASSPEIKRAGVKAGEVFTESFTRDVNGRLHDSRGRFVKGWGSIGDEGGRSIGRRLVEGLVTVLGAAGGPVSKALSGVFNSMPPQVQAAIGALIIGGVVLAAPGIGAAMSGALLGGISSGVVATGIVLAFQDPMIKAAGKTLAGDIKNDLIDAGSAFVWPTLRGIGIVRREWRGMLPEIRGIFQTASQFVEPLVRGITGLVRNSLPGIRQGIEMARPVIDAISQKLPELGAAIGGMFKDLGQSATGAAMGIRVVFDILIGAAVVTGKVLSFLSNEFERQINMAAAFADKFGAAAGPIALWAKDIRDDMKKNEQGSKDLGISLDDLGMSFDELFKPTSETQRILEEVNTRQEILNSSMEVGIEKAGGLAEAFDILNGKALDAREAESKYQDAIDKVTESIDKNGKTLDLNTAAGRANDTVLRGLIDASVNKAQATYNDIAATQGQAAANSAANAVFEQGRQKLIASAMQMGLTRQQAEALANQIMRIPPNWNTNVHLNVPQNVTTTWRIRQVAEGTHAMPHGQIGYYSRGGPVRSGSGSRDDVPAMLMRGEYVLRGSAVRRLGLPFLHALNEGRMAPKSAPMPIPTHAPVSPAVATTGGGTTIHIGSIVIPAKDIAEMKSVADFFKSIQQTARRGMSTATVKV